MLVHQVLRDEPADVTLDPERSALDYGAGLVDVLRILVGVLPVLEHRVDLAIGHRLGDVGVCGRARPGLLVDYDLAAVLAGGGAAIAAARGLVVLLLAAGRHGQRQHQRHHHGPHVPVGLQTAPPPGCTCCLLLSKPNIGPRSGMSSRVTRWPWVTRSSAMPSARIASDATTPRPNSLRCSPRATRSPSAPA